MTLLTVLSRLRTNNPKGLGATLTFGLFFAFESFSPALLSVTTPLERTLPYRQP